MTKKRKAVTETNDEEAGTVGRSRGKELNESSFSRQPKTAKERDTLDSYRKNHDRRMKELEYESSNGYLPPRPWYEE